MLTLKMNVDGVTRTLQLLSDSLSQAKLKKPLSAISKTKQAEVRQRFEQGGPGWAPRSPATLGRLEERSTGSARGAVAGAIGSELKRTLARASKGANVKASTLARRRLERAVIQRLRGREEGILGAEIRATIGAASDQERARAEARVAARVARTREKVTGRLLGRLANSIRAKIDDGRLILESSVEWSAAQNSGGAVGNGVTLPPRTFLEWTSSDIEKAAEVFRQHMIDAVVG